MRTGAIFPKYIRSSEMKAKKFLSVLMALALVFASVAILASCGEKKPTTAKVTFDPYYWMEDDDDFEVSNEDDLDLERDVEIGAKVGSLPKPKADGYTFGGWYAEDDEDFEEKYKSTTKVEEDITLVAKWTKDGGTEDTGGGGGSVSTCDHVWTWNYEDPTCEQPSIRWRQCALCGEREEEVVTGSSAKPALGHNYGTWTDIPLGRTRKCSRCSKEDTQNYNNITSTSLEKSIELVGEFYSTNGVGPLTNGNWTESMFSTITTKSSSEAIVLYVKSGIKADMFYIATEGPGAYVIKVRYEGEDDYRDGVLGSFGNISAFDLDNTKNLEEIRVEITSMTDGSSGIIEVAIAVRDT